MAEKQAFIVGQRWLSNTEADLGLGVIMAANHRMVNVLFPAAEEERNYALENAPLTRLMLQPEETVKHVDGWSFIIIDVMENNGLLIYNGVRTDNEETVTVVEIALDHSVKLNQPEKRLLSGQFDKPHWFDARQDCLHFQHQHATSGAVGLVGARVDLIPHQLHIANEVGKRFAPRVLLADEVGLGKTIEAGLVLHQQMLTGKVKRVLIVVPSSLVHQWLVEMLRRVNLAFSVFDTERFLAMQESGGNPFEQEQLVLCDLDFIQHEKILDYATAVDWDLLIVDEAHHLHWSADHVSSEYAAIEALCRIVKGVLLLTATPDQLGHESHFARLRLLDPARFHSYQAFQNEEKSYVGLAQAVSPLIDDQAITQEQIDSIQELAPELHLTLAELQSTEAKHELLIKLIDRHGTGRLLFRNSRASIQGFPTRHCLPEALIIPEKYAEFINDTSEDIAIRLHPERHPAVNQEWTLFDPRVEWLVEFIEEQKGNKILVICAFAATALQLAEYLRVKTSIKHSVFHEGMSIVDRDKAAHFFASEEEGAQVLLCSEIGSEGRNFQFSSHLVLFDLPLNPDLLEQRIGRLDRIGQRKDINLHIPYFRGSAQAILFDWYQQGLSAFERTCPIGGEIFDQYKGDIFATLDEPSATDKINQLIDNTHATASSLLQKLHDGRDKLLELNASGFGRVETLIDTLVQAENSHELMRFMSHLFDTLGVNQEEKEDRIFVLKPSEAMMHPIPGIPDEGVEVTYHRNIATKFEHLTFLSWDSELVSHCIDSIVSDVMGKSSIAFLRDPDLPAGAYWIEIIGVLEAIAEPRLQAYRFLPTTPLRICVDAKNTLVDEPIGPLSKVKKNIAVQLIQALTPNITKGINAAMAHATEQLMQVKADAIDAMNTELDAEIDRLTMLQQSNPSIRDEEINFIKQQKVGLNKSMNDASPYLDAVRLIVNNPK